MINPKINAIVPKKNRIHGISLIELLVGVTIGLIATLVITQVFVAQESVKRSTTSAGDAQQSGGYSTFALERYIQSAGAGIAHLSNVWGCPLKAWRSNSAVIPLPSALSPASASYVDTFYTPFHTALGTSPLRLAPILILNGGGETATNSTSPSPDRLIIMAGQHESLAMPLTTTAAPTTTTVALNTTVGINQKASSSTSPRDLLLAVDQDAAAGVSDCRIVQANNTLPTTAPTSPVLVKTINNPVTLSGSTYTPTSPAALTGYSATVQIGNLGSSPNFIAIGIGSDGQTANTLMAYDLLQLSAQAPISLADSVVNIQAVYGVSSAPDQAAVSSWVAPTGTWSFSTLMDGSATSSTNLSRLRAVRLAIITRSAQPEKTAVSASSWTLFSDISTTVNGTRSTTGSLPEVNFRYRTYDITVPLRNMLLMNNS